MAHPILKLFEDTKAIPRDQPAGDEVIEAVDHVIEAMEQVIALSDDFLGKSTACDRWVAPRRVLH